MAATIGLIILGIFIGVIGTLFIESIHLGK